MEKEKLELKNTRQDEQDEKYIPLSDHVYPVRGSL
jgi:hypothetical protein